MYFLWADVHINCLLSEVKGDEMSAAGRCSRSEGGGVGNSMLQLLETRIMSPVSVAF